MSAAEAMMIWFLLGVCMITTATAVAYWWFK
jgi:hypothetical protein